MELVELEPRMEAAARRMTRRAPWFFDDFLQEMWVAVLEAPRGQKSSWYLTHAVWRAIDWLRAEIAFRTRNAPAGKMDV